MTNSHYVSLVDTLVHWVSVLHTGKNVDVWDWTPPSCNFTVLDRIIMSIMGKGGTFSPVWLKVQQHSYLGICTFLHKVAITLMIIAGQSPCREQPRVHDHL